MDSDLRAICFIKVKAVSHPEVPSSVAEYVRKLRPKLDHPSNESLAFMLRLGNAHPTVANVLGEVKRGGRRILGILSMLTVVMVQRFCLLCNLLNNYADT